VTLPALLYRQERLRQGAADGACRPSVAPESSGGWLWVFEGLAPILGAPLARSDSHFGKGSGGSGE